MCDTRTNLYRDMSGIMDKTYSQTIRIFNTIIPHSTKVGEANLNRKSVLLYDENSKPSQAYKECQRQSKNVDLWRLNFVGLWQRGNASKRVNY
jgi:cellulose biosynthesis protein BcsQ